MSSNSKSFIAINLPLLWRHNGPDGVSNQQPHDCLLNRLFGHRSKKTSKSRVNGLCVGNSPVTGEFPAQMASYAENVSIWWRHHAYNVIAYNSEQQLSMCDRQETFDIKRDKKKVCNRISSNRPWGLIKRTINGVQFDWIQHVLSIQIVDSSRPNAAIGLGQYWLG